MRKIKVIILWFAVILLVLPSLDLAAQEAPWLWVKQFGTGSMDHSCTLGVAKSGQVHIAGYTEGSFESGGNMGSVDAFVTKEDTTGNMAWVRQFGTRESDQALSVVADDQDNLYLTGNTYGAFPGYKNAGSADVFLAKYDTSGRKTWIKQFGTQESDYGTCIARNSGGDIYLAGETFGKLGNKSFGESDVFLAKYDYTGETSWIKQFGTNCVDHCTSLIATDDGEYAAGDTCGELPNNHSSGDSDAYLAKYDPYGEQIWARQFGTKAYDYVQSLARDKENNVYVLGDTKGAFPGNKNAGLTDIFLAKYDSAGLLVWLTEFGTKDDDHAKELIVDSLGNIYLTGDTKGAFAGNSCAGNNDVFLAKFDVSGRKIWIKQFGTADNDFAAGLIQDSLGNLQVTGDTYGRMGDIANKGGCDVFLAAFKGTGMAIYRQEGLVIEGGSKGYVEPGKNEELDITLIPRASEKVNISITDGTDQAVWAREIKVTNNQQELISWNGVNSQGVLSRPGLYQVRISGAGYEVNEKFALVE